MKKALAVTTILLAGVMMSGCTAVTLPSEPTPDPPAVEEVVDEADEEPVSTPEPIEVAPEQGTRGNPYAYGEQVVASSAGEVVWEVTVGEPFEATKDVMAENRYNDEPKAGFTYIAVPVAFVYSGDDVGQVWMDFDLAFVDEAGVTHDEAFVVQPWPDLMDINDLYEGGTAEAVVVIEAPKDVAGLVRLTYSWDTHAFIGEVK